MPIGPGAILDGLHQRPADAVAAGAAMHEQLGDVGAVRLVLGSGPDDLDGAHRRTVEFRDQQFAAAGENAVAGCGPKRLGLLAGKRRHEADRRAPRDAIDEDVCERGDICVYLVRRERPHDNIRDRIAGSATPRFILSQPRSG